MPPQTTYVTQGPSCTTMVWDYTELGILSILSAAYIIPGVIMIRKYKLLMDTFSLLMVLIYIIGFVFNIIFVFFDVWVKKILIEASPDRDCNYIDILEDDQYISYRVLKSVNQSLNYCEHQAFIIGFNFFVFKLRARYLFVIEVEKQAKKIKKEYRKRRQMRKDSIPDSPKIHQIIFPGDETKHSVFDSVYSETNNLYSVEEDDDSDKVFSNMSSDAQRKLQELNSMKIPKTLLISGWDQMKKYILWILGLQIVLVVTVTIMQYFNHFSIYSRDQNSMGSGDYILIVLQFIKFAIDLFVLVELIKLLHFFHMRLVKLIQRKSALIDKKSLDQEKLERAILVVLVIMYVLRIGISDVLYPILTSRFFVDSLKDYQLEESQYQWLNFISDVFEAFTAYTTIYLFYIYIKKQQRQHQKASLVPFPKQYPLIEAPNHSLRFDDNIDGKHERQTFAEMPGGIVRKETTIKRKQSVETLFSFKHDEHSVRLKESFKEKLLEENKKRTIYVDPYGSSQHDSSGVSSNGEIADRMNQQLLAEKMRRQEKGGVNARKELVLSGEIDLKNGESMSKNMLKGNVFYGGWRSIMGGNTTSPVNNKGQQDQEQRLLEKTPSVFEQDTQENRNQYLKSILSNQSKSDTPIAQAYPPRIYPVSQELKASISNISAADGTGGTTINQDDNSSKNQLMIQVEEINQATEISMKRTSEENLLKTEADNSKILARPTSTHFSKVQKQNNRSSIQ